MECDEQDVSATQDAWLHLPPKTLVEQAGSVWEDVMGRARLTCDGMDTQVSTGHNTESVGSTARGVASRR